MRLPVQVSNFTICRVGPRASPCSIEHHRQHLATRDADAAGDTKEQPEIVAKTEQPAADAAKPLAPPPRPGQAKETPDYFSLNNPSLNQEPNPFEKSFGSGGDPNNLGAPETPGGTKLPPVASITSPSSLLPGTGTTPFNWAGGSLRTGPLSPAMLSAPQGDYFSDQYRGGFPTPNESSLRTGLTPGGSGSMFPTGAPSPSTAALLNFGAGGVTPSTVDFHKTAIRAAAAEAREHAQQNLPATSQPQEANGTSAVKSEMRSGPFDNPDNDAANGLFMLAQGRNGVQQQSQYPPLPPQSAAHAHPAPAVQHPDTQVNGNMSRNGVNTRGASEARSDQSDDSEQSRPHTRGKKRAPAAGPPAINGRRKAEEPPSKPPASKKAKSIGAPSSVGSDDHMDDDEGPDDNGDGKPKQKMTEEEKRKNFLERNR